MPKAGQTQPPRKRRTKTSVPRIGRFEVTGSFPGQPTQALVLDPQEAGAQQPVAQRLAEQWEKRAGEVSFSASCMDFYAIKALLMFCESKEIEQVDELTSEALFELERWMLDTRAGSASRYLSSLWLLLRPLPELPEQAANVVQHAPAVLFNSYEPTEALTDAQLKAIIAVARNGVSTARHRLLKTELDPQVLLWHETLSLYVLLLFETALSMDVLKHLDFSKAAATRVVDWGDDGEFVAVSYQKLRGGAARHQMFSTEGQFSAGRLMQLLRDLSAPARELAAERDDLAVGPWLGLLDKRLQLRQSFPECGGMRLIPVLSIQSPFREWLKHHNLADDVVKEGAYTSFRAIRPAAKALRLDLTDTSGLHSVDLVDDHSQEVYTRRYQRSKRLMHAAGNVFFDIAGRAEEVVRNFQPTVISADGACSGSELDANETEAYLRGEREFGLTACATPKNSPFPGQTPGELCGVAFRACFQCPSAVVSPRHVERMRVVRIAAMRQRHVISPPEWESLWGETVRFIDAALSELEGDADQFVQEPANVLDLGVQGAPR